MRLIDADRLTDAIEEIDWYHLHNGRMVHGANSDDHQPYYISDDIYEAIRNAPTVDAVPVVHGEWIDRNGSIVSPFWERYECSECGARSDNSKYCPNCGADMRG